MRIFLLSLGAIIVLCPAPAVGQDQGVSSPPKSTATSEDYVLQPLDLLQVKVFQEPGLDREIRITRDNMIALPLIGGVNLRGRTLQEAEAMIRDLYDRDYLVNPQINIVVLEYARRAVNVMGSINSPGEVLFPSEEGLTLLDAISRAGGFSRLADRRKVKLTRTLPNGESRTYIVNADEVIEGSAAQQWRLQVNDLIFVPERML